VPMSASCRCLMTRHVSWVTPGASPGPGRQASERRGPAQWHQAEDKLVEQAGPRDALLNDARPMTWRGFSPAGAPYG
jgi:hypothetical protein